MLDTLDPINVVERDSLSHMLADEKLHGTRERDESAPRPDFYYFRPGSKYVLIEDATGKNRTIMVKEYSAKEQDWPVLHEQFLRLTSSCALPRSIKSVDHLHRDLRARAMALYVNHEPYNGEEPPAPSLKRSASVREFSIPALPEPEELPYVKASGNSVVLTSNIASTSTTNTNPTPGGVLVQHQAGGRRGAMQVSKRVEVLKRNLPPGRAGATKRPDALPRLPGVGRRKSAADLPSPFTAKEFMSQAEVVTMLHGIRNPTGLTKPTYDERLANRELVDAGQKRKEQDTASGYCENCRIRYTDLSVHMASRKHRRFALNAANFADLDEMLHCLQRPPNPLMCVPTKVCRPCTRAHTKDAECGRCMDDADLWSSPPPSETSPGSRQHMMYVREQHSDMIEDDAMSEDEGEVMSVNDEAAEAADRADDE
jgi:regulatory subunit for Cdc7p protein kinase